MDTEQPAYNPEYNPQKTTNPYDGAQPAPPHYEQLSHQPMPPPPQYEHPMGQQPVPPAHYEHPMSQQPVPPAQYEHPMSQQPVHYMQYEHPMGQQPVPPTQYGYGEAAPQSQHVIQMTAEEQHPVPEDNTFKFSEKSIRLGFIKKVFCLLFCQLILTAGLMCIFIFVEPVKEYIIHNDWVYITSICLTIVCTFVFAFVTRLRKMWPVNLICLIIITLVMSTMLGSIACSMDVDEILISVGIVAAVVLVCAILGFQKRFDFTPMVGFVCMFGMCLFAFGFLCIFFYNEVMTIVYCSLGALLFALWLLLDIQLILGGKHKIKFDPEDYVGGALTLYVDIVYMLMMIFFIFKAT